MQAPLLDNQPDVPRVADQDGLINHRSVIRGRLVAVSSTQTPYGTSLVGCTVWPVTVPKLRWQVFAVLPLPTLKRSNSVSRDRSQFSPMHMLRTHEDAEGVAYWGQWYSEPSIAVLPG